MSSACLPMDKKELWENCGWILRGKQRKIVLLNLPKTPLSPESFRKGLNSTTDLKLSLREMSRHLKSFQEKGIISCLTKNAPYGKLYQITPKGSKLKKEIELISN